LRPLVYAAIRDRESFERVIILYGARSPSEILFAEELERWGGRFDMDVMVTVDTGGGTWRGAVGFVTELVHRGPFDPVNAVVYVCGPEVMIRHTALALQKRLVSLDSVYVSMERNMKCGIGVCGHCQFGPHFLCTEGPVFRYPEIAPLLAIKEV
jgi:NAD(P)H-flavin reductase